MLFLHFLTTNVFLLYSRIIIFYIAVEMPQNVLTQKLLETKGVYILDCYTDVFVW